MSNESLGNAKIKKNDEFYTQYEDIESEVKHFANQLRGKSILLPCDTEESNFYKFFKTNFSTFGLVALRATHLDREKEHSFAIEYNGEEEVSFPLSSNGDFFSQEI